MNVWGGSFRPDYAALGLLRGRFPGNVPFLVASATLPEHVLDDINARPNIALSVRVMEHSDDSKGDLRFLIPPNAKQPMDVPITLVYCNQRSTTEDCADRAKEWAEEHGLPTSCIAFYHALIGQERKRKIEDELRAGNIRILPITRGAIFGMLFVLSSGAFLQHFVPLFNGLAGQAGIFQHLEKLFLLYPRARQKMVSRQMMQSSW